MADVLKNFPFMSIEDYKWKYSSNFIRFMCYDATRVIYHSEKWVEANKLKLKRSNIRKLENFDDVLNLSFLNINKN